MKTARIKKSIIYSAAASALVLLAMCFGSVICALASENISLDIPLINMDAANKEYEVLITANGLKHTETANAVVASYDANGTCIDKAVTTVKTNGANFARIPFDAGAVSYKVMLLDSENLLRPLCPAVSGELEIWDYEQTVTVMSEDLKSFDEATMELSYYLSPTGIRSDTIKLDSTATYITYNDYPYYLGDFAAIIEDTDVTLEFADTNSDALYDRITATKYTYDVVEEVDLSKDSLLLLENNTIHLDFEDEDVTTIILDSNGNEISLSDIKAGDVVAVIADSERINRYIDYIKIVKVLDATIEGMVEENYTLASQKYIIVGEKEYIDISGQNIIAGDEGIFYVGLTGKVFRYDLDYEALNYAYILEGGYTEGPFGNVWRFTLLTEDGRVITHDAANNIAAEKYVSDYPDAFNVADNEFAFADATSGEKTHPARLVTYEINANDKLKITIAEDNSFYKTSKNTHKYNLLNNTVGNYRLKDEMLIFDVSGGMDSAFTTDISHLRNFVGYTGFVFANPAEIRHSIMLITDSRDFNLEESKSFAIVTEASDTQITFIQDKRESTITVGNARVLNASGKMPEYGDVFLYFDDGDNDAEEILVIATLEGVDEEKPCLVLTPEADTFEETEAIWGASSQLVLGYISNTRRVTFSTGYMYEINGEQFLVDNTANMYLYDHVYGDGSIITTTSFDIAYIDDAGKLIGFPILIRLNGSHGVDAYATTGEFVIE